MKTGTLDKLKFKLLKNRLRVPLYAAVGLLEGLWYITSTNAPDGAIGRFKNIEIAAWLEWEGDADLLIDAFVEAEFLDRSTAHRLIVHDWADHCPHHVKNNLRRWGKEFAKDAPKEAPTDSPKDSPKDAPSNSNQTKPNQTKAAPDGAGFSAIRTAYPKREGSHRWSDAERFYAARIREGHTHDEIMQGVTRYVGFCRAKKIWGTDKVQQAATFLGKNKGFLDAWTLDASSVVEDLRRLNDNELVTLCRKRGINTTGKSRDALLVALKEAA